MFLRDHPLVSYHGLHSWPPAWIWIDGDEKKPTQGEVGTLKQVTTSNVQPANRFFLYMQYEKATFLGCLMFDDYVFCRDLAQLLKGCYGRSIQEIGGLDLSHFG
jgi:hypothetical protein